MISKEHFNNIEYLFADNLNGQNKSVYKNNTESKNRKIKVGVGHLMLEFVLAQVVCQKTRNEQGKIIEVNTILYSFVETGRS